MRKETRTRTYTADYSVYITDDGKEFQHYYEAMKHEKEMLEPRKIEKHKTTLVVEDEPITLYHLLSQEDYNYAKVIDWDDEMRTEFQGPGWYIVYTSVGSDCRDSYFMIRVDDYIASLEADLISLKCLTSN